MKWKEKNNNMSTKLAPPKTFEAFFASFDQNETVDNLYCLCAELEERLIAAENCLVCAAIADPFEVIENTLEILSDESN